MSGRSFLLSLVGALFSALAQAAYRGMQITVKTHLGNIGLAVKAVLRNDKTKEAAQYAGTFLLFHKVAGAAFNEKTGFKRDAAYGADLAEVVKASAIKVLGDIFDGIEVETSEYVRATPFSKFAKAMEGVGFEKEAIAEMWAKRPEAKAETPEAEAADDEVVG